MIDREVFGLISLSLLCFVEELYRAYRVLYESSERIRDGMLLRS